jgi:hypothetical protein
MLGIKDVIASVSYLQICALTEMAVAIITLVSTLQKVAEEFPSTGHIDALPPSPTSDFSLVLKVEKAEFALSTCSEFQSIPLFLANCAAFSLNLVTDVSSASISATASLGLRIQDYNWVKRGWEPLLEHWNCRFQWDCRAPR